MDEDIQLGHLDEVQMGYFPHMYYALSYSIKSAFASCIFCIHAIYPDTFTQLGYALTKDIVNDIEFRKNQIKKDK